MKDIIIVGGGSAGWMTAATLIKFFPNKNITLIESPNISTVGVGESTIAGIRDWVQLLEIDEDDFVKETDASYKLSIKFTDFYKKGESFHYPFGEPDVDYINDWWFKKFTIPDLPYEDYAECYYPQMQLIKTNKFNKQYEYAYHFDATKFGLWLKNNYCIPRGVKHIQEDIKSIEQNEDGITSLNNKYKADLYIDCTGFKSMLLGEAMAEPFESFEDILPNNSAWATKINYIDKEKELVPYTNCTAYNNGWIWNIPLRNRIGTGYVYSDKFVSDEEALKEFKQYLNKQDLEFKNIKMRVGIHKRLWVKNVCAIGLAAGFIEPLESNGLFSVHEFLIKLVRNMQRDEVSQWDKDNFTYQCKTLFTNFAEFVALHYALSHRKDTEYWKNNFNKTWSDNLINLKPALQDGFLANAMRRNQLYEYDTQGGYHCIAAGMHHAPTDMISILKNNKIKSRDYWISEWKSIVFNLEQKKSLWKKQALSDKKIIDFL